MNFIFFIIWRLIVIYFSVLVALLAASIILSFGISSGLFLEFLGTENYEAIDQTEWGYTILTVAVIGIGFFASFQLASLALLPIIIAVAITEMMRWQGLVADLLLGGACALFVVFTLLPKETVPSEGTLIVTLAMGFVGGFFYWLIAGRGAGNWQDRLPAFGQQDRNGESGQDAE